MLKQFIIAVIAACPFPHSRGTPLRIQRLSEALVMAGHEVHIFTYPIGNGMPIDGVSITRTQNPLGYKKYVTTQVPHEEVEIPLSPGVKYNS